MRCLACLFLLAGPVFLCGRADESPQRPYENGPGAVEVDTHLIGWKDAKRDRDVPAKVYLPRSGAGPFPVIVFSHGLGGSREGYEYLGRHWASHGYVCVHLQHRGSDDQVWKGKKNAMEELRKAVKVPANAIARPLDVRFTLDELEKMNREGKWKGRLDLKRVGLAGHSFGAFTTLACAGQTFFSPLGGSSRQAEPRIVAAIAMSPQPQHGRKIDQKKAFGTVKIPVYHLTGTLDDGVAITETKPADRRIPYDNIPGPNQYLTVFADGDHAVFAGAKKRLRGNGARDPRLQELIRRSTTAFWDAHLRGDARARTWLTREFPRIMARDGTFEVKEK